MEVRALIHEEDGSYWAEVVDLPGCFASGHTLQELIEGLEEAIRMCLPPSFEPDMSGSKVEKRPALRELTFATG